MRCEQIKQKIDDLVFDNNEVYAEEVFKHITECNSCQLYFHESEAAKPLVGMLKGEPELKNPKVLTNIILSAIEDVDQTPTAKLNNKYKIIPLARRSLAVASIGLILIFGFEHYIVFDKIQKLENTTATIANEQRNISLKKVILYNSGMQIESFKKIFSSDQNNQLNQTIKTRVMLARLSSLGINEIDNHKIQQLRQTINTLRSNYSSNLN